MPRKKSTVEEPVAEAPVEAVPEAPVEEDVITRMLALETAVKAAAADYPSGNNSDAMKSALSNAAHGIAHVRKVLDANARVER